MLITELFAGNTKYEITKQTAKEFRTVTTIGNRDIVFYAEITEDEEDEDKRIVADVEFFETKAGEGHKESSAKDYGVTNSGDPIKVFDSVGLALKEMIKHYKPWKIYFTAEKDKSGSDKRAKLYERMLKKYLPTYQLDKKYEWKSMNGSEYIFIRKDK